MVEETSISIESLEAVVGGLGVRVVGNDDGVDPLDDVMGGNNWSLVLHTLTDLWQFLVLILKHA